MKAHIIMRTDLQPISQMCHRAAELQQPRSLGHMPVRSRPPARPLLYTQTVRCQLARHAMLICCARLRQMALAMQLYINQVVVCRCYLHVRRHVLSSHGVCHAAPLHASLCIHLAPTGDHA